MSRAGLRLYLALASIVLVAALALAALQAVTRDVSYPALLGILRAMPRGTILAALAATVASYAVLLANDLSALRYAEARPPWRSILLASFCGYALGNAVGLGSLSGGAVRYRVYRAAGLSTGQIARVTIFIAGAFGIGATAMIGLGLACRAGEIAARLALSSRLLASIAALLLGLVLGFVLLCALRRQPIRWGPLCVTLPEPRLVVAQLGITILDITAAATALWMLLPAMGMDFLGFLALYAIALGLGVLSHSPGGVGVFDAALLYAIGGGGPASAVAAALVAYRAIYFLLPLLIAMLLLAGAEIRRSFRPARQERQCEGRS